MSHLDHEELRAYFRPLESAPSEPHLLQQTALEFHRIVEAIFATTTVVPFRFPSFLPGADELRAFLGTHQATYVEELVRLNGLAQLRITLAIPSSVPASSGTDYLRRRAAQVDAVARVKDLLGAAAVGFRDDQRRGADIVFALVKRSMVTELMHRLQQAGGCSVSGPWPPAEFVTSYPRGANV